MSDLIKVDTEMLVFNIEQIKKVKNRASYIDRELNILNKKYDLLSLLGFQYNGLQKNNYILNANIDYLTKLVNDVNNVTDSLNKIDPLNYAPPKSLIDVIQDVFKGDRHGKIIAMYAVVIQNFFENKREELLKVLENSALDDLIIDSVGFLKGEIFDSIDDVKDIIEYIRNEKIDLGLFGDAMDSADHLDNLLGVYESIKRGDFTGVGENLLDEFGLLLKRADKKDSVSLGSAKKVLINIIINMPTRFIKNIEKAAKGDSMTSGEVYWDSIIEGIGSEIVNFAKPTYNLTTAIAYPLVDDLLETTFSYDLSSEYEKLSGEKGIEGVFKLQKELWVDTIYEEGIRKPGIELLNGFYEQSGKLVNTCWKSFTSIL